MILRNKQTQEKLEVALSEFKIKFAKELRNTFDSFKKSENSKQYFKLKDYTEEDFYFNLQWSFNHLSNSAWYIERL
ncbi:MAG: hypothetical protein MJ231_07895 [bacterium]|nr:hypothetical protein [bacterium]